MARLFLFVLLVVAPLLLKAQTTFRRNVDIETLRTLALPVIDIATRDGEEPTYDEVTHPPGAMGKSITNATKVAARMTVTLGPDTLYDSGNYMPDQSGMTIKVRGNTSAYNAQKPYKIKLEKKADLLRRGNDDVFKDKHWVLLGDAMIETPIGFAVSRLVGMEWTPAWEYVNVVMNGQYRGLYILCEQVRRNEKCRLDVDKTSGYIVEHDPYWWNEAGWFETTTGRKYTFKYPEEEDVTATQTTYIRSVMSEFEESIADGTYPEHIDVESFARFLFAHDILGTWDAGGSNQFIAKQDERSTSLLRMPCLWDFNTIGQTPGQWSRLHTGSYPFFASLIASPNTDFVTTYGTLLQTLESTVFEGIDTWLADFSASSLLPSIERSRQWTGQVYGISFGLFADSIRTWRQWFSQRRTWMAGAIDEMLTPTAISSLAEENKNDGATYDLSGRRVSDDTHGLVVRRGKVFFNRK